MSRESALAEVTRRSPASRGCFVAVVGPSGAGKDTLIARAAAELEADETVVFARRVVTRQADGSSEDHDSLDPAAFAAAEAAGAFCLTWRAHGLHYGLPAQLVSQTEAGRIVVANLSRSVLGDAAGRFSNVHVVEVSAQDELLVERIVARGRESRAEAEARVARAVALKIPTGVELHRVDNSGDIRVGAEAFLARLREIAAAARSRPD